MVISSEFHMRGYEDDDHQHDAHLFIKIMFSDRHHLVELYTGYSRI